MRMTRGVPIALLYVAVCAASALVGVAIYGFDFGIGNNEFHTVIVDRVAGIGSFDKDLLATSLNNFVSPFW